MVEQPLPFTKLDVLGQGAYGEVFLATMNETGKLVAVKEIDKQYIARKNASNSVERERDILYRLAEKATQGVIRLLETFENEQYKFFIFEACTKGTLSNLIKTKWPLPEGLVQRFAAQLELIIESIHYNNVMHRDIKPENLLIDDNDNLVLIDFGGAKYCDLELEKQDRYSENKDSSILEAIQEKPSEGLERRGTTVGSGINVAPEMLESQESSRETDLWQLGIVIFFMLTGQYPFGSNRNFLLSATIDWPRDVKVSPQAQDLVQQLIKEKPEDRLGAGPYGGDRDYEALRQHPFFEGVDFVNLFDKGDNFIETGLPVKTYASQQKQLDGTGLTRPRLNTETQQEFDKLKIERGNTIRDLKQQDPESVVYEGFLVKKRHMWTQKRKFVLHAGGTLKYYDEKDAPKGELPVNFELGIKKTNKDKFELEFGGKKYPLSEVDKSHFTIDTWIEKLRLVQAAHEQ